MIVLGVGVFGGLGAVLRLVADGVLGRLLGRSLPWATLVINLTGSFLLGLLTGLADSHWLTVLGTGLCGGYTTFGTACWESVALARDRRRGRAGGYAVATLVASLAAAAAGLALGSL